MLKDKSSVIASGHCDSYFLGENHISISKIFYKNKHRLLTDFTIGRKGLSSAITEHIDRVILCYLHNLGHSLFEYPSCDNFTFIWHTFKSRFCNKCGIKYQK